MASHRLAGHRHLDAREEDSLDGRDDGLRHLVWILGRACTAGNLQHARRMLAEFGSLGAMLAASPGRQLRVASGDADVVANLQNCSDLISHVLRSRVSSGPVLSDCAKVHDYLRAHLGYSPVERFRVLYLDVDKRLIRDDLSSIGTVDRVSVHAREVIRRAIDLGATALILVHNHPSGGLVPSAADKRLTKHIASIAGALDIELIDHLIVSAAGVASLRRLGELQ